MQAGRPCAPTNSIAFADPARWNALTQVPAKYGFHSTIKAPFELSADSTATELLTATESLCSSLAPVDLPDLCIRSTSASAHIALRGPQSESLLQLTAAVVSDLEDFRAPLMPADIARRRPESLSLRQRHYLDEFGYPFVFDEFNFHMTLTGPLDPVDADFIAWLEHRFEEMVPEAAASLDRLAVYRQTSRETAFVRIAEFPFATVASASPAKAAAG